MDIRVHIGIRRLLAGPLLAVAVSAQAQPELVVSVGHANTPRHVVFAGGHLATASRSTVALIDLSSGLTVARFQTGYVVALEASPVEDIIAVGTCGRSVELWDVKSRRLLHRLAIRRECVTSVSFSPDGALLATTEIGCCADDKCCGADGSVRIWDVRTGTLKQELAKGEAIQRVVFGRNGRWLAGAHDEEKTTVFEWPSGRKLRTFGGLAAAGAPESNGFSSPDGRYLAWQGFREVQMWDVASGTRIALSGTEQQVPATAAEFLDDGRFAYVDEDRLRIVTLPNGPIEEKPLKKPKMEGSGDVVLHKAPEWLCIHRNGRTIAGTYETRTVL